MSKTWFITGAGRGFGREFAIAALSRGDRVAATARKTEALGDLAEQYGDAFLPLAMDVTDGDAVKAAVSSAADTFGGIDVLINNAGYGLNGAIEEISEQQLRDQFDVNVFGVFRMMQAVLPIMRQQGSGHLIQITSIGGIAAFPLFGGYNASKWAVEAMSDSLSQEVASLGIKVTIIEPGAYETDFYADSAANAQALPQYDPIREETAKMWSQMQFGNPKGVGPAILKIVDADAPPLRVFFGSMPTFVIPGLYEQRLKTWKEWEAVSIEANGN
ncbi:SDR family NAD(P)-dependent oxidoreductase [Paracoccus liaowanqingii]|uniref:SDR family NAD(P)-dependent oxidoreductase n=1 Tax=Paracoccus liaowanqingii TaxID=2560053 RepID=A0A4Z1C0Q8_9RHOB|nr:SDR family NAD(P)-dependent oxidoreductase [Paracoccus liaowanqingii]TGN61972.1 SDR family NAD(P)-dependent oxidoreductase [Paracoccus liaowanqingii]